MALLSVKGLSVAPSRLCDVSFELSKGETLGIVGESGSGKSTLARAILRLEEASGEICFDGEKISNLNQKSEELRVLRAQFQMVFQDPYSSLNPAMKIGAILEEPLLVHSIGSSGEKKNRVSEIAKWVGVESSWFHRFPHELSGGQRQRVAIARALVVKPKLIIADEPVSALDVLLQRQILELFKKLREELNVSILLISHDLFQVRHLCDRTLVLKGGRVVEFSETEKLFRAPKDTYTRELLHSIPSLNPKEERLRLEQRSIEAS